MSNIPSCRRIVEGPMAEPTSTEPTLASSAKTEDWRDRWQHQDAWTVREFAQLCCGWNPSVHEFPDRDLYDEAVESINRAVRVKVLPTIELLWPGTGAERIYDSVPMFRPREVASWAAKRYPSAFPYSADAWEKDKVASADVVTELTGGERYSARWEDVKIEFISDDRVQVTVNDKIYTRNYSEMGFENRTTSNANLAWITFREFAKKGGALSVPERGAWKIVEKRMQEIRKALRVHFLKEGFDIALNSDPLPFSKGTGNGYRAVFRLTLNKSFNA